MLEEHVFPYIEGVLSGEIVASKRLKKACKLIKKQLNERTDLVIDDKLMVDFPSFCRKVHGINLYDAQLFMATLTLCVYTPVPTLDIDLNINVDCNGNVIYARDENGELLLEPFYKEILQVMGRGAGKNKFIAAVSQWLHLELGVQGYDIHIVANTKKQAEQTFMDVYKVLAANPLKWKKYYNFTKLLITHKKTGSTLYAHSAGADKKDGLRIGFLIFDEIHAYKNFDEIKVMLSALGKAIPHQRVWYITTNGNTRGAVYDAKIDEADVYLDSQDIDCRKLILIYEIDDESEYDKPNLWRKANPALPFMPTLALQMRAELADLINKPDMYIEFLTKRLNRPPLHDTHTPIAWDYLVNATNHEHDLWDMLKGYECIGCVDYADVEDFCAVGLLFHNNKRFYFLHHTIINKVALNGKNFAFPLEDMVRDGIVTIHDKPTTSPQMVADWFDLMKKHYRIIGIAADNYRLNFLRAEFENRGYEVLVSRKGTHTHTQIQPMLVSVFANELVNFARNDRMMRWYFNNAKVVKDGKGNITYEKIEPDLRKTDGFDAFLHAFWHRDKLTDRALPFTVEEKEAELRRNKIKKGYTVRRI